MNNMKITDYTGDVLEVDFTTSNTHVFIHTRGLVEGDDDTSGPYVMLDRAVAARLGQALLDSSGGDDGKACTIEVEGE